jgi:hypothetical protein
MNNTITAADPSLRLRDINERLAPVGVTVDGLKSLGFEPAKRSPMSTLYHDSDLPFMLTALIQHLVKVRDDLDGDSA